MNNSEIYLRAILSTVARQSFPPEALYDVITSGRSGSEKQIEAYNLCDGSNAQTDISKSTGLDKGSFSRSLSRWIDAGIVIRLGEGRDARPLHVYPLPDSFLTKAK